MNAAAANSNSVNMPQLKTILRACLNKQRPMFVWGPPGVGKSDGIRQVVAEMDGHLIDVRASLLDPVDLRGVPSVVNGQTRWNPPIFLPTAEQAARYPIVVIFLDELAQAIEAVQSSLLQLVLDRQLGEYSLPTNVVIVAAGNRVTDGTFSRKMSKALTTRFATHVELLPNVDQWCKWALDHNVSPEVIAFNRLRPDLHMAFDPKAAGNSFPCPRVWAQVSDFIDLPADCALPFLSGALGDGPAAEFLGFLRLYKSMPDLDAVLMNPDTADVPTDPSTLYAVATAMARKLTAGNAKRAFTYMGRLSVEFQVVWLRDALHLDKANARLPEFTAWAIRNGDLLS
jgi:hypothetical protein